ncbi:MAG: metallophosphoesterase [Proteobacteria bacterium]|nr:metallophosphoesterase [Pseudomonadota bacterium]
MSIAYLTDVEGKWEKLASFAADNPLVSLVGGTLRIADGATFVFGGDAIDRGPHARRIVDTLLAARRTYGDRVVLLAGNRDLNKLRLVRELGGAPPPGAPTDGSRGELLRWIFANTMGARSAFEHRATELGTTRDDDVVDSFLADLAPTGALRQYLAACRLGYRAGATLFVHGGVTSENHGYTPGGATGDRAATVDAWLAALDAFYTHELAAAHPAAELPAPHVVAWLQASGIDRVVVGHTPSGDCPAIVRAHHAASFELVFADNSYGRVEERGSQLAITDAQIVVAATTELDDGTRHAVDFARVRAEPSPVGLRTSDGHLVKAQLADGRYLLFRGLADRRVEQVAAEHGDLARLLRHPAV